MKVAIIGGSGKMGQWFARFLAGDGMEVVITGRNEEKLLAAQGKLGVAGTTDNVAAVKGADVVLISVPIDNFEPVVEGLAPHIRPGQTVVDITSVKVLPVEVMHRLLKDGLVLGVHPMFGPGARDIRNQNLVLTPTKPEEEALARKIKEYLEARGARTMLMSPSAHDELMAIVLGLSHFIAIVASDALLGLGRLKDMAVIGGTSYRVLLTLVESVISENPDLYASLQMSFPKMVEVEELFLKKAGAWAQLVKSGDKAEFASRMSALRDGFAQALPDFGGAYEKMYRILDEL
ncbi:prephenate dehydrogenase [Chloroflexota bacterium]